MSPFNQDSQIPEIRNMLSFSCIKPIETVYTVLEGHDVVDLLRDNLVSVATTEIYSEGRSRREIQRDIKKKEQAIETLSSRYARNGLTQETVRQCLYSIGDNHAFLRTNRDPCEKNDRISKGELPPDTCQGQQVVTRHPQRKGRSSIESRPF